MIRKTLSVLCGLCLLAVGCESTDDPSYTFNDTVSVQSTSEPLSDDNALVKIVTGVSSNASEGYIVFITGDANLQRLNSDKTGYMNIPVGQYTIITPGDSISIAWTKDQIDYSGVIPIVRPDTIVVLK